MGSRRSGAIVLLTLCTCLLYPTTARADGINFAFVGVVGIAVLVPLTAFVVLVESAILAFVLRAPFRRFLRLLFTANVLSLLSGIPVKIFNMWMYWNVLPTRLAPYFREYPAAVFLGSMNYFWVTVLVEGIVIRLRLRTEMPSISRLRTWLAVLAANIATYAVLAPIHYVLTIPTSDIKEFVDDASWAREPATRIYYVAGDTQYLSSILSDGTGQRTLIRDEVRDYQWLPGTGLFLYRNGSNAICLSRKHADPKRVCWDTHNHAQMNSVAFSPDGRFVVFPEGDGPYEFVVCRADSGDCARTGFEGTPDWFFHPPEVAWSRDPAVLFVRQEGKALALRVDEPLSVARAQRESVDLDLSPVYGRLGRSSLSRTGDWEVSWTYGYSSGDDWGFIYADDEYGSVKARTWLGLNSRLLVTTGGETTLVLAINRGLLRTSQRHFRDVCFLDGGHEIVFEDGRDLYLLDLARWKVGWIASGSRFCLETDRYRRTMRD